MHAGHKVRYFTAADLTLALECIFTPGVVPPVQIGSFLTALHIERIERRPDFLAAAANVLRARALKAAVEGIDEHYAREQEDLQNLYYQLSEAYHRVKQSSSELIAEERAHVTEAIKEVEVLVARLEYEINGLVSKVDDVEDGVRLFERQVEDVEKRAEELKRTLETEGWAHWFVRTLTGIGTGPNITRGS